MADTAQILKKTFGPTGKLAHRLPHYEQRPDQLRMAAAVAAALHEETGRTLAVEAETGIGKTLAYLVPAALSGQRVVVSTNTLNLQEQILRQEIPFIRRHLDPELSAICVKGRQNYLCLHRWHQLQAGQQQRLFAADATVTAIAAWLEDTKTGDRAELPWLPDGAPIWQEISATASQCLGSHCPAETACFISQLRRQAAASRLLIVNHHLFFADLALRRAGFGEVLPRYESVIFDEAHHLENVATQHFGASFSHYQVLDLANDLTRLAEARLPAKEQESLRQAAWALAEQTDRFAALFPRERGRFPLQDFLAATPAWPAELAELQARFDRLAGRLQNLATTDEIWAGLGQRCAELVNHLQTVLPDPAAERPADAAVRWFERRDRALTMIASPVDIAGLLQKSLYSRVQTCIFTSATLTTAGNFDYFLHRLGLPPDTATLSLPSPFDYAGRTLLYIPGPEDGRRFPEPGEPEYQVMVQERIHEIILASRGRALVLFTSMQAMAKTHAFLADRLPYPVLLQGEAPRTILLDTFRRETDSVLLAVASFWEGVNVPGESLSCVVIDKLPFEVPSDPVIMARMDRIKEEGGNPFFDFQVPRAILALRQGVGRLLRAATDKGLLAIMDVRLFTKGYGRLFRASLPPSPVTRRLADVKTFFENGPGNSP